ncbi:MAG: ABC transporter ATP-binding protein [Micropruina sp.]|uniref:ABC transporter ATP-binding protein n=1 Tax=Micropruina sp. TaxID=2737536 RepID=UPI0039E43A5E
MTADQAAPAAIEASGLRRTFGDVVAVDGVDLEVPTGAVLGLLGPDGAGKSTLIRMLATVLRPDAGDAHVQGFSVTRQPGKVTPRIGYMSQKFALYPDLSVAENIEFFARLRGVPAAERKERSRALLTGMGLADFLDRQAGRLSGGMKQKLFLATTLMHRPEVLLLDEPTTGVDPVSRREFWRILADLRGADRHGAGTTVLVATPYMDEAERCTDVIFLDGGRVRHHGSPAEIKALVPGRLFELRAAEPRTALGAVETVPGVLAAHLYGDIVRVLADTGDAAEVEARLAAAGVLGRVRAVAVDMETAFAVLAELNRAGSNRAESNRAEPNRERTAP